MDNNYQVLQEALDKATQKGAFNLQETALITQALIQTRQSLENLPKLEEQIKVLNEKLYANSPESEGKKETK